MLDKKKKNQVKPPRGGNNWSGALKNEEVSNVGVKGR